jgi:diacylglycerol O-acyltransferase
VAEKLTALDGTFLRLEELDEGALMNLGGVMVFDPPAGGVAPTVDAVREQLSARLGELPRYTQRLSSPRAGGLTRPHWVPDERFDIRHHVGHAELPAPGDDGQLRDWTAEFFSRPLDRSRPLWEMVLIEGLESGRWALGWKTHHCLVDGVVAVELIGLLLGPGPTVGTEPTPPRRASRGPSWRSRVPEAAGRAGEAGLRVGSAAVHAVSHPREALDRSRRVAELLVRDELRDAPRTSLNVPIGRTRRYAVVRAPLEQLKASADNLGGSITDVVLAAATSGLRELLLSREEVPPRGLRALVPVTRRDASDRLKLGNLLSFWFVDLPVGEPLAPERLRRIAAATRRRKSSDAARAASTMIDVAALTPPVVAHAALIQTLFSRRMFNVAITNVPGAPVPLYAFGAPLRELYPVLPLLADHAVGIAALSYNGQVTFGITADASSMPDVDVLARGIAGGLEELRALLPRDGEAGRSEPATERDDVSDRRRQRGTA